MTKNETPDPDLSAVAIGEPTPCMFAAYNRRENGRGPVTVESFERGKVMVSVAPGPKHVIAISAGKNTDRGPSFGAMMVPEDAAAVLGGLMQALQQCGVTVEVVQTPRRVNAADGDFLAKHSGLMAALEKLDPKHPTPIADEQAGFVASAARVMIHEVVIGTMHKFVASPMVAREFARALVEFGAMVLLQERYERQVPGALKMEVAFKRIMDAAVAFSEDSILELQAVAADLAGVKPPIAREIRFEDLITADPSPQGGEGHGQFGTEWRAAVSADAKGKFITALDWCEDMGGYWVMQFSDETQICFHRTMAEHVAGK